MSKLDKYIRLNIKMTGNCTGVACNVAGDRIDGSKFCSDNLCSRISGHISCRTDKRV